MNTGSSTKGCSFSVNFVLIRYSSLQYISQRLIGLFNPLVIQVFLCDGNTPVSP